MRERLKQQLRVSNNPSPSSHAAHRRRLLNLMLLAVVGSAVLILVILLIAAPLGLAGGPDEVRLLGFGGAAALLGAGAVYALNRYVSEQLAAVLFVLLLLASATLSDSPEEVVDGRGLLVFALPIMAASVLLRPWASFVAAGACSLVVVVLGMVVAGQPVPNLPAVPVFFLLALMAWLATRSLERALERQRAASELARDAEAQYRRLVENVNEVIYALDAEGVVTYISPAIESLAGYSVEEVVGKRFTAFIHPDDLPRAVERFAEVARGVEQILEYRILTRDGGVRWVRSHSHPFFSQSEFAGLRGVLTNVTERKRAEEALRASEARFRATFEDAAVGIALVDDQGRLMRSNAALQEILGYSEQEFHGMHFAEITEPEDRGADQMLFQELMRGERETYRLEKRYRCKQGHLIWGRLNVSLVRDADDEPAFAVGMVEDITERKRAQDALQESEERYRTVFETTGTAMIIIEEDTTISLVNAEAERLSGYAKEEIEGRKSWTEFVAPEDQERMEGYHRQRRRDPDAAPDQYEIKFVGRGGRVRDVLLSVDLIPGTKRGVASVLDITERKRATEALQERMKELTCLHAVSSDMQKALSLEELCQRIVGHLVPALQFPGIARAVIELDDRRFASREAAREPARSLHAEIVAQGEAQGEVRVTYAEDRPFLMPEEQDLLNSVAEALGRWLERREAQEDIRRQLRYTEALLEIDQAISSTLDLDQVLDLVLDQLQEVLPYDSASLFLLSDGTAKLVAAKGHPRPERAERVAFSAEDDALTRAILDRGHPLVLGDAQADGRFQERGGADHVRSWIGVPLIAKGAPVGLMTIDHGEAGIYDETSAAKAEAFARQAAVAIDNAQLHESLHAAYDDLRQSQRAVMRQERLRALGEMASGIAHDINNAISPIPLYAGLIQREADLRPRAQKYLHTIRTAVHDVKETVGRMRQFYRKREKEEFAPVAVNDAVQEAIALTRPRWRDLPQERGVTVDLETHFQEDLPPVMGNEGEIRQAVTNLILNAVDAMPHGGTLSLRTRMGAAAPAYVIIAVADTGVGMDEETRERCIEPFFSTKGERGTGMGLATTYGTMQRHGGDVQIESALGEGTTVRLLFPVYEGAGEEDVEEVAGPASPLRILCVDDEPLVRDALQDALEGAGHSVELADGGEAGLTAFQIARRRGEPFDVVITDLGMPGVTGRQVAQRVKAASPETPVILLTGWGQQLSAEETIPDAVDLLLNKPPSVEALNRALGRVTASAAS